MGSSRAGPRDRRIVALSVAPSLAASGQPDRATAGWSDPFLCPAGHLGWFGHALVLTALIVFSRMSVGAHLGSR